MLTIIEYLLFSKELLKIINNYDEQSASQLFDGYNNIPCNYITDDFVFHYIARNTNELEILLSFFDKFKLSDMQTVKLKTMDITQEELNTTLSEYKDSNVIDKLLIDVSFDKSGDLIEIEEFDQIRLIIDEVKKTTPNGATNLEIITHVYNWLKKREYKHNDINPNLSKRYSSALLTEYIVCVGFSKVFNNILSEYGISASEYRYHLLIDGEDFGHDISIVKVQDEKYGVDGLYFFDLTRDCYNPKNNNDYKYSGFMMTYEDVSKDNITKDMFNKMLLFDTNDIQDTIVAFKPVVEKLTIYDDRDDFDESISLEIRELIFNLMQIDCDLFRREKTVDIFCIGNPDGAMYFICNYILFLKSKLGEKIKDSTIIDLLINTIDADNPGWYLAAINSFSPTEDYSIRVLEKRNHYIKKRLGTP